MRFPRGRAQRRLRVNNRFQFSLHEILLLRALRVGLYVAKLSILSS